MKFRYLLLALLVSISGYVMAVEEEMTSEMQALFNSLQDEGKSPAEILGELLGGGVGLSTAAGYTVANAPSVGLAVAYAQTAVCLSGDVSEAQQVGEMAIESASEQARNAVQARVTELVSGFEEGSCQLLADERNNASQAFGEPGETSERPVAGAATEVSPSE